jgi:hypothetical protein
MLGKTRALGKWKSTNRWQAACNESNAGLTNKLANDAGTNDGVRENICSHLRLYAVLLRQLADHGST